MYLQFGRYSNSHFTQLPNFIPTGHFLFPITFFLVTEPCPILTSFPSQSALGHFTGLATVCGRERETRRLPGQQMKASLSPAHRRTARRPDGLPRRVGV